MCSLGDMCCYQKLKFMVWSISYCAHRPWVFEYSEWSHDARLRQICDHKARFQIAAAWSRFEWLQNPITWLCKLKSRLRSKKRKQSRRKTSRTAAKCTWRAVEASNSNYFQSKSWFTVAAAYHDPMHPMSWLSTSKRTFYVWQILLVTHWIINSLFTD